MSARDCLNEPARVRARAETTQPSGQRIKDFPKHVIAHGDLAERNKLLSRIERRYPTSSQLLRIGSLEFDFTRVADPERVLDDAAAAERSGPQRPQVPYWAELWDSAFALALRLATAPSLLEVSSRILDLGCGMGLPGTAAAALGARVTFADFEALALMFARVNSLPWKDRVDARRLDWRCDLLGRKFDLILGADLLYERSQWEFLDRFWEAHLESSGVVLLGEPGRQTGDEFLQWICHRNWVLTQSEQRIEQREKPVRIFELRRR